MHAVITTIQSPTDCVGQLVEKLQTVGATLVVAGDKKGPAAFDMPATVFLSLADQQQMPCELARVLPTATYARKNMAYLYAFSRQATSIYETDDDNAPMPAWTLRPRLTDAVTLPPRSDRINWFNVYRLFSDALVWPRGYPLRYVNEPPEVYAGLADKPASRVDAPVQQGLANHSPDVDAVWRLVLDRPLDFHDAPSVAVPEGTYCPFNSQSTWWWPPAYPLMYLPSTCSFRMTDIWRSFIAQRCLWAMGTAMVFHGPEVRQERNAHDLLVDFRDEVPGYLGNERLVGLLDDLALAGDPAGDLLTCYRALTAEGFFEPVELEMVQAWVTDLNAAGRL